MNKMGKIIQEFETEYDKGDVVIFKKHSVLLVGVIEGYYLEDDTIWYIIRTGTDMVYTFGNGGDVGEFDVVSKINGVDKENCLKILKEISGKQK